MLPRFSPSIVERLAEPLIVLGTQGEVRDFNTAARPLLRQFIEMLGELRRELAVAAANKAGLPRMLSSVRRLEIAGQRLQAWLCECGDGFAVIFLPDALSVVGVHEVAVGKSAGEAGRSFYALFNNELRQEIGDLRVKLETFAAHHLDACVDLLLPVQRVASLLSVLHLLSALLRSPEEVHMERFSVGALLDDVLKHTPGLHGDAVNAALSDSIDAQGFIYGCSDWLRTALQALLDVLTEGTPPDRQVELRIRQHGNFLVITGGHGGARRSTVSHGRRACEPRAEPVSRSADIHASEHPEGRAEFQRGAGSAIPRLDAGIRLAVARMVTDFHKGMLRLQLADNNGGARADLVEGFTLELPTGAPPERECSAAARARCIYPAQARALAQDLAQMLPKAVPGYVISSGEASLLRELILGLEQR